MFSKPVGRQLAREAMAGNLFDLEEQRGAISRANIDESGGRTVLRRTRGRSARCNFLLIGSALLDIATAGSSVGALYTDVSDSPVKSRIFFYAGYIAFLGAIGLLSIQGIVRLHEMGKLLKFENVQERNNTNGVPVSAYRWNYIPALIAAILYAAALPILFEKFSEKAAETANILLPLLLAIWANCYDATLSAWEDEIKAVIAEGNAVRAYERQRELGVLNDIINPERDRIRAEAATRIQTPFRGFAVRLRARREKEKEAATKIQAIFRGFVSRRSPENLRKEAAVPALINPISP